MITKRRELFGSEEPSQPIDLTKYFPLLKKSAAILLIFLFVFSPIAPVLAEDVSTTSATSTEVSPSAPSASETPVLSPDVVPQAPIEAPATDEEIKPNDSDKKSSDENPAPQSLLDSTSYEGPIDPKTKESGQNLARTDEHTGALLYDYPIDAPPGRNGFQPDFKLSYNSQNTEDGGVYGYGWSDNIPYIERINKTGVNNLYSTSTTSPVYFNSSLSGELIASTTATSTFSSRVDNGEFLNYTFQNDTWTAKDKNGNTYVFGTPDVTTGTSSPGGLYSTSLYNDANLVSYYQMESNANDSKSTNHGTSTSITYNTSNGKFTQGAGFGGSSNISLGDPANLDVSAISIAFWLQVGSLANDSMPASKWDTDPNSWLISIDGSGGSGYTDKIRFNVIVNEQAPSWNYKATSNDALTTDTWYHIVATYDGSTVKLYVNGTLQSETTSISGTIRASNAAIKIGSWLSSNSNPLPSGSKVDDFAIFSRALNSTEVNTLYNAPAPSSTETSGSRQSNPLDSTKISKWMLDYVLDPNGNQIKYEYYKSSGQIYPYKISYAGNTTSTPLHTIELLRQSRDDNFPSYKTGYGVSSSYRVNQIKVKVGSVLIRQYDLTYTTGNNGLRSILQSIQESGYPEGSTTPVTLPATTFNYQTATSGFSSDGSITLPNYSHLNFEWGDKLADVNGDGLFDYLASNSLNSRPTVNAVYIQQANGSWATSTTYSIPFSFYSESFSGFSYAIYRLEDINGDALPDFVTADDVWLNNGANWVLNANWYVPVALDTAGVLLTDLNGDGLPEFMNDSGGGHSSAVYLNLGTTWGTTSSTFSSHPSLEPSSLHEDHNNDSIGDLLRSEAVSNCSATSTAAQYGNGSGSWIDASSTPPIWFQGNNNYCFPYDRGTVLMDIDGDGLNDIFQGNTSTAKRSYQGTGKSWSRKTAWEADVALVESNHPTYNRIVDLNGDGMPDFWAGGALINQNKKADLLTRITLPTGGFSQITYKPSPQYKVNSTTLANPSLPLIIYTASEILINDGTATTSTDSFLYKGGSYYYASSTDRKFAGFNEIDKTDAAGNVTKTFYHQANVNATSTSQGEYQDNYWKIGKPYRVEKYDANSNLIEKTINKWDVSTTTLGTGFVKLAQTVVSTYEGDVSHKDKAETYTYNNSTGNVTTKVEYGEVTGSDDGTFSDTGTDDFTTAYTYATSSTSSVVSLLSSQSTVDHSSNKVKEFKLYYDGLNFGRVDKGNVTKREDWKTSSTYVDVEKTYNSYGLVLTEKDPRDKTTTYSYDSYNLYPATVTSPVSHVSQFAYDYSSGKVATTTDPNGNIFVNVYDGLDRLIEQKQPNTSSTSTLETKLAITYSDNRNGFKVQQSSYLTSTSTVDSYTYLDGLARKKQERAEAEGSNFTVKDYVYDTRGFLQKETLPYFSLGSASTTATSTATLYINYYYDALGRAATTTNAIGTTTNTYLDWQVKVTDPNGVVKDLYYDAYGNLKKVDEHNGASTYSTNYTYNYLGNLLSITDAINNVRNFTYDGLGRRLTAQDLHAPGDGTYGSYTYTYDDAGNMTQQVDPKSQTINYTYDDINRQLTEDYTGQGGTEVTYTYDTCTQGKGKLCTASSTTMTLANTYNALGQLTQETKVISGNSYATSYTYDRQGNQLTITNPDSSIVSYVYNAAGQINQLQRKEYTDSGYIDVVTNFDYSPLGQLAVIEYTNCAVTTNTYDATKMYRLKRKVSNLESCGESLMSQQPPEEESLVEKPPMFEDLLVEIPSSTSTPATSTLESISEKQPSTSTTTATSTLDSIAEPTSSVENNTTTPYTVSTTTPEVISTPEINTTTTDSLLELPTSTTTPPQVPTENEGAVQSTSSPVSISHEAGFFSKIYTAIADGINWLANGIGNVAHKAINLALNTFGIKTAHAAATELYDTALFQDANLVSYYRMEGNSNDSKGSNNGTDTSITYNSGNGKFNQGAGFGGSSNISLGDPASLDVSQISIAFWLQVGDLSNDSVPASKWDSDSSWILYIDGYGGSGFPDKLRFNVILNEYAPSWSYKATSDNALTTGTWYHVVATYDGSTVKLYINGQLQSDYTSVSGTIRSSNAAFKLGSWLSSNSNALPSGSKIDDFAVFNRALTSTEISDLYNGATSNNIQDITYTYDNNGNITQITDASVTDAKSTTAFIYDPLNRLTSASTTLATTTPFNYSYTYDALGNMLTRVENGTSTSYFYATSSTAGYMNPHTAYKIGNATSTFDSNGNLTAIITNSATSTTYTWDYNNRLTQASSTSATTNVYDPWGQRVKQTVATSSSVTTYYPSKLYNTNGTIPTKNIFLPDGTLIATVIGTGTSTVVNYIHGDHLGGMNVATSDESAVSQVISYYPYGGQRINEQSGFNSQRQFANYEFENSSGLNYLNQRYLNSANTRFLSQDPAFVHLTHLQVQLKDPQSWNSYAYARNNPVIFYDPNGLFWKEFARGDYEKYNPLNVLFGQAADDIAVGIQTKNYGQIALGAGDVVVNTALVIEGALAISSIIAGPVVANQYNAQLQQNIQRYQTRANQIDVLSGVEIIGPKGNIYGQGTKVNVPVGNYLKDLDAGKLQYRTVFENTAEKNNGVIPLPQQKPGYYSEYTLPTPNTTSATNPQRFVVGGNGEVYYTPNHYESFIRVRGATK